MDKAARRRTERNNPPGKDGSLGDRLNWELLLVCVPKGSDIHVVSRDKDFASPWGPETPNSFLSGEWRAVKEAKMYLYSGIKSFVGKHFPDISLASDVDKKLAIKKLVESTSWQATHSAISNLSPFSADITSDEANELFNALVNNDEINAISGDEDVTSFYQSLLTNHWNAIESNLYKLVTQYVKDDIPF